MQNAPSFSPLQLFTPIQLFFCVILFFLPWIEIQCVAPKEVVKDIPKESLEKSRQELGWDPSVPFSFLTQSGFEIAIGGASPGSDTKRLMSKMEKEFGAKAGSNNSRNNNKPFEFDTDESGKKKERATAPLLFAYFGMVLVGIAVGLLPFGGIVRRLVVLLICLTALGILGAQIAMGFPIEQEIKKEMKNAQGLGGFGQVNPPPGGTAPQKPEVKLDDMIRVKWQIPLYATLGLLVSS